MSGVWGAAETGPRSREGGFHAELTQDGAGRLSGVGVSCRGLMEYALTWVGGFEGGVLALTGTPRACAAAPRSCALKAEGYAGVLSGRSGGQTMNVFMQRLPAGE